MTKLTNTQRKKLRGEGGPYSEINIVTQTRVLDDRVSRTMKYIEMVINPLTFEIVAQNVDKFDPKLNVAGLVQSAENRGRDGYVVMASPEIERRPGYVLGEQIIEVHKKNAEKTLIAMHKFVMKLLDIDSSTSGSTN